MFGSHWRWYKVLLGAEGLTFGYNIIYLFTGVSPLDPTEGLPCPRLYWLHPRSTQGRRQCGVQRGPCLPHETRVPPPVFADQRRRAQLSQFSLKHSPLLPPTFFTTSCSCKYVNFMHYTVQCDFRFDLFFSFSFSFPVIFSF